MSKLNIVFDASQFDLFRLCECRFNYRYNLNLATPTKAKPLDRGFLVHLACETYYDSLKSGAKYEYAKDSALMKVKEGGVISTDLDNDTISRVVTVMEEYFDYWRVEDQGLEIVAVENPFIYLLHETEDVKIHMAGKIDLIVNHHRDGHIPWDHKSYDRDYPVGRMSNQFKNYALAMKAEVLRVNRIGFQRTLASHEKFKRIPLTYDEIYLNEWKRNVVKVMDHYLDCVAEGYWPLNETSCDKFNRKCEYYDVCDSSGEQTKKQKLLQDYIVVEPWDVSAALRKPSEVLENMEKNVK